HTRKQAPDRRHCQPRRGRRRPSPDNPALRRHPHLQAQFPTGHRIVQLDSPSLGGGPGLHPRRRPRSRSGGGGMTTTYKGWYLLDHHKNRTRPEGGMAGDPRTKPWYASRRTCQHGYNRPHLIVIHTPETIEDFTPPYDEAERVAKYGAQTTLASWHDTIDADSIIPMLPPTYTAWQVRGFNRCAIGMEIGAKATSWKRAPAAWVTGVVGSAAYRAAQHAASFEIPARLLFTPGKRYSSAINPTGVGFVSHHALDPSRRTDPGFDFPWDKFITRVRAH